MTAAARRFRSMVDRLGETFSVGVTIHTGVFSNVNVGTAKSYMSAGEVDGAHVPLYVCLVRDDDTTTVDDSVSWNGLTLVVERVLESRFGGEVAAKMLVFSRPFVGEGA